MKAALARWALEVWYKGAFFGILLLPLAYVYSVVVRFRRYLYRKGILKSYQHPVLVVVVGNITVGGTGKTPLVIRLAQLLKGQGFNPGIISRGYGGSSLTWPQVVTPQSDPAQVGDEPVLMARQTQSPVVVSPSRNDAASVLLEKFGCDVIVSDDGLQHYALNRDIEIVVIDGERRFGNGHYLPAGPLREPTDRLATVDFAVVNGKKNIDHEFEMALVGDTATNLITGENKSLSFFQGKPCHALAGIGNPSRFFRMLEAQGLHCIQHPLSDHHQFEVKDLAFDDDLPVLMTEKDAVKCTQLATDRHWFVPIQAKLDNEFERQFLALLNQKHDGQKTARHHGLPDLQKSADL